MMKRIAAIFLTAILFLGTLSGCDVLSRKIATLQSSVNVPENGILTADFFAQLQEQNGVVTVSGTSNDMLYEWTVFGSDIRTPQDCNLAITLSYSEEHELSLHFLAEEAFGFSPVLSVYLNDIWDVQSATLYRLSDGDREAVSGVTVTGSQNSILNFSVAMPVGDYVVVADTAPEETVSLPEDADTDTISADGSVSDTAETTGMVTDDYLSSGGKTDGDVYTDSRETEPDAVQTEQNETNAGSTETDPYLSSSTGTDGDVVTDRGNAKDTASSAERETAPITDDYLSNTKPSDNRIYSDGKSTEKDKYKTDPVPEGKPMPVEPEDQKIDKQKTYTCTFSIECSTILNHLEDLNPDKLDEVPSDGIILPKTTVSFYEGESVYDVLQRVCRENGIHMEASFTPMYNSAYVEGIHNLYEFDCGSGSGWMYRVDGWYPNYGCSRYQLKQGEVVEWRYTCELGQDIGGGYAIGG